MEAKIIPKLKYITIYPKKVYNIILSKHMLIINIINRIIDSKEAVVDIVF